MSVYHPRLPANPTRRPLSGRAVRHLCNRRPVLGTRYLHARHHPILSGSKRSGHQLPAPIIVPTSRRRKVVNHKVPSMRPAHWYEREGLKFRRPEIMYTQARGRCPTSDRAGSSDGPGRRQALLDTLQAALIPSGPSSLIARNYWERRHRLSAMRMQ
ncbi:uncharacterized protein B0H18DRAFT_659675 [Fomitopsis serialis]|uniref:uncharacterized protein n=1 Tax=Fomitopsis serialis TaxID=139415 RepID=UPI002008E804|nr:uncharacterized protein B0H18DRAFT_659675 [Neoantrodia serialis]KAH9918970.1 hypothetical protein B0H18DRAFT_659675 [Neoantrodia serialis]